MSLNCLELDLSAQCTVQKKVLDGHHLFSLFLTNDSVDIWFSQYHTAHQM
jgi:hypothetical protein